MRALILAGGKATRLRPLTDRTPKAMTPVLGRPFLEHMLAWLARHDVRDVILLLGYLPDPIRAHFGDGHQFGVKLSYLVEDEPLGSGGAIKQIEAQLTEPFFALNGDIFTDIDLGDMRRVHRAAAGDLSMYLTAVDDVSAYGVAAVADGTISRFVEKPPREQAPSNLINAGVWLFEPEALQRIAPDCFTMVEQDLFPDLATEGRLKAFVSDGYWMDAGTPHRYLQLQRDLLAGRAAGALAIVEQPGWPGLTVRLPGGAPHGEGRPPHLAPGVALHGPVILCPAVEVGHAATIEGPTTIGDASVIGERAAIADSVLWDRCHVGANARIHSSILATGCVIGDGAHVENAVLGEGVRVAPGATAHDRSANPGESIH